MSVVIDMSYLQNNQQHEKNEKNRTLNVEQVNRIKQSVRKVELLKDSMYSEFFEKLELRCLTSDDIISLKELCSEWFPIKYPDSWYNLVAFDKRFYSLAAVLDGDIIAILISEIKPRYQVPKEDADLLSSSFSTTTNIAYILSLGVHRNYRRRGVASFLLQAFLHYTNAQINECGYVKAVYLHVLSTNTAAIKFYEEHKFQMLHFLPSYYVINGQCRDGFSYVLYINGGKPVTDYLDCFKNLFSLFRGVPSCKFPNKFFTRVNKMFRYFLAYPNSPPLFLKSHSCRNL